MSFVPQALKDKIVNYITTGKAPRFQKGGIGNISIRGYKSDSPDRFNAFNIIPSNHITMQDVPHPVWGVDDTGASQLMMPGNDYRFPGRTVFEVPVYPEATVPFEKIEKNYKQNGGPINMSNSRKPIPRRRARYNSNAYMQSGGEPGYPLFPVGVNYVFPGQDALGYPGSFQTGGQPRLVNTVPADYHPYGQYQGQPTYAKDMGANLPAATGSGQGGAQYEQFLIKQLASGVTPEQLAQKRYIDASQMEKYRQYYKPSRDVVYTQPPPQPQTPPDYMSQGYFNEDLYSPDKRLAAFARNKDRNSRGQSDPGTLNSAMQPVELMFVDNMGKVDPSKGRYFIPHDVYSNQMTHGTNVLQDTTGLSRYLMPPGQLSSRFQTGGSAYFNQPYNPSSFYGYYGPGGTAGFFTFLA